MSSLNGEQLKPVMDTEGAVLVTAGAGSGKTRLLTHRIAHIVCGLNVPSYNILAITFTNKAAREMKERLAAMIPYADDLWVSTFHSMCAKILRRYISLMGYNQNFSIYDDAERTRVIKAAAESVSEDNEDLPDKIAAGLSQIKNSGSCIEDYCQIRKFMPHIGEIEEGMRRYEAAMKKNNALDFDDLLAVTYNLLAQYSEPREYYQNRFRYIHVDEFQDTNVVQYRLVRLLSGKHGNLFAVGDEDQSIYGWRGANIGNIKDFVEDTGCKIYKLEQNYRSTKNIIGLANSVIKINCSRIEKQLWTENEEGGTPQLYSAASDSDEADYVMQSIKALRARGMKYSDIAVLMRVNALSRSLEQKFLFYGVPYKVYGGFKFFERREIKDMLAYLRLAVNPFDDEAAIRAIAFPKKGIGEASVRKMLEAADCHGVSLAAVVMSLLWDKNSRSSNVQSVKTTEETRAQTGTKTAAAGDVTDDERLLRDIGLFTCQKAAEIAAGLPSALKSKLLPFAQKLALVFKNSRFKPSVMLKFLYKTLEIDEIFSQDSEEDESRKLNIRELINAVMQTEQLNPDLTVEDYVQQVALYSELDAESTGDTVTIATVHSAKGLEYDAVFIVGLEDGLFPLSRAIDNPDELEEERRLMYVAITRARKELRLTYARTRFMYGRYMTSVPSRFLKEAGLVYSDPLRTGYGGVSGSAGGYGVSDRNGGYSGYGAGFSERRQGGDTPSAAGAADKNAMNTGAFNPLPGFAKSGLNIKDMRVGQRIKHKRLGEGTVRGVDEASQQAEIEFDDMGVITLAINFAPITLLD